MRTLIAAAIALLLSATAFSTAEAIHWKREARQAAGLSAILLSVARAEHAHSLDLKREFGKRGWCV